MQAGTVFSTNGQRSVQVCQGLGCESRHSEAIRRALETEVAQLGLASAFEVKLVGCPGFCQQGPVVMVEPEGVFYTHVDLGDAAEIARVHLQEGRLVERLLFHDTETGEPIARYADIPFYKKQQFIVLRNCGHINPEDIDDYLVAGGYDALRKVLTSMTPVGVIEDVKRSGLRGRGGAGFPTGVKWESARDYPGQAKYVICNADEGDPGAFMDRSVLESDPLSVIEGMTICGYAVGTPYGYIYVRAEYPLAIKRLRLALAQARARGFIGDNILGTDFSFDIEIREGAGAFVCGESTALMRSIEGRRGTPRLTPPRSVERGLWGQPTVLNNVKTFASVPVILMRGADWYASIGTQGSRGTAVFALTGKINNSGLIEVPMGTTLREVIFEVGGGVPGGKKFKAVQTGGPSGGCIPRGLIDLPVDFDSLDSAGAIMGSGGMVVMDEDTCMVDIARFFTAFCQSESCGVCTMCRLGTQQMLQILEDITNGRATMEDLDLLEDLSRAVKAGSFCGLGQSAPNPVLSTIRYFRHEYEAHIKRHKCPAVVCGGLVKANCSHACPAGVDVPRYIRAIADGKYGEAVAVIRERIPFPSICGRVCLHFCEAKCRRSQLDEPLAIRALKRFAADHDSGEWRARLKPALPTGKRVAIIGSGPAGLTAGYYLARLGHAVTVFESLPKAGGMLRVGIPDYRLPKAELDAEIEAIASVGVDIRLNTRVESVEALLIEQGYDAVLVAVGAHEGRKLPIPGADLDGVILGTTFLRDVNLGQPVRLQGRVLVLGGGNVAIDCARCALRLGADEVHLACLESYREMPASSEEVEAAEEEGVVVHAAQSFVRVVGDGRATGVECVNVSFMEFDDEGRLRLETVPGSEHVLPADVVIFAIGQGPDLTPVKNVAGVEITRRRTIGIDPYTMATDRPGVYAAGDAVSGTASVIEAIAAGRDAAIAIDRYLGGNGDIEEALAVLEEPASWVALEEEGERLRPEMAVLSAAERRRGFAEIEIGLSEAAAREETTRCLRCDLEEH